MPFLAGSAGLALLPSNDLAVSSIEQKPTRWWRYTLMFAAVIFVVYGFVPPMQNVAKGGALAVVVLAVGLPFAYYRAGRHRQ